MNKEFIPYEEALVLKELGFEETCFGFYCMNKKQLYPFTPIDKNFDDTALAPLYQQTFRWFREKYNLRGFIGFRPNIKKFDYHVYDMTLSGVEYAKQRTMEEFNKDPKVGTYEETELACLRKLVEFVKENEDGE